MVASHESAAYLHDIDLLLPSGTTVPRVTLTRRPQAPSRSLVRGALIRVAMVPDDHITTVLGVPVTTVARTVTDIARTTGFMEGVVAADSALRKHTVLKVELAIVLRDCAQWKGIVRARQVLDFADGRAESALESVARVRFAQYRIPPPGLQANICGTHGFIGRVDFCWDEYQTIAEADGALKYEEEGRARARAQLARDEKFHDAGWGTFHFTWREIYHEPTPTIDRLRRAFARNRLRLRSRGIPTFGGTNQHKTRTAMAKARYTSRYASAARRGRRGIRSGLLSSPSLATLLPRRRSGLGRRGVPCARGR